MDKLYSPTTIKSLKETHDFRFSKSLGQNFLRDGNIVQQIIEGAEIGPEELVIEIGPGIGVLTAEAAERAAHVVAVEIDGHLIPILKETLAGYENVSVVHGDILKTDLKELIDATEQERGVAFSGIRILGNLPYYITTPILMKILEEYGHEKLINSITIMLQKEVAERIQAKPGTKTYGALSVAVQYYCVVHRIASVPKEVFVPRPQVDSAVIRLDLRETSPVELKDEKMFFAVVKAGFGQKRKTLLNALTGLKDCSKERTAELIRLAGIDPIRRAETLELQEFADLANQWMEEDETGKR